MSGVQSPAAFTSREQSPNLNVNPFHEFIERYRYDPVGFVQNVFGEEPDEFQAKILEDVFVHGERQISARSGHGVGKSALLAWIAVIACCVFEQAKIIQTAPSGPQLWDALFAETRMWFNKLPDALRSVFVTTSDRIAHAGMPDEIFISARTSRAENPEAMQGVHADKGIVILMADEASGIPESVYEAGSGSMSGKNCVTILTGNPTRTSGLFFDTHHKLRDKWRTYVISCVDSPRCSPEYIEEQKHRFGEDSDAYRVRVLGEFPRRDSDVLIALELVVAAQERDIVDMDETPEVWGLDVARYGDDSTALCRRRGKVVPEDVIEWRGLSTMETVGRVKNLYDEAKQKPLAINVDVIGVGAGVVDRMMELGLPVYGVNVSEQASMKAGYINLRAELWDSAKKWLEGLDCRLPRDQKLAGELTMPRYKYASSGKMQLESKEDMRKRKVKSPNRAESFVLTLANDAIVAQGGKGWGSNWNKPLKRRIKGVV